MYQQFNKVRVLNLLGLLLTTSLFGCSAATGTIEGTVTADGKPVKGVEVIFRDSTISVEGSGISNSQGQYRVFYGRGNRDLPTGEYQLTLGIMLPEDEGAGIKLRKDVKKFNDVPTSKAIASGSNVVDIELDSQAM
ncbi:carboxypeptidase-like regulatory domain-containing protein [Bremerella alba]|uniref:Carboxypeptidase regulatory-like domain-containing protein n=1 Tax=Bremerella alba TaxID=980252 RepID=A0A7V8V261_9BACT|nr:carboxypeptidase-like regulatory domain-containing protein [Bremerella alba]MBA2113550.1 hypothetical protein [Bremerella alba]